jgi:hypothetical protein
MNKRNKKNKKKTVTFTFSTNTFSGLITVWETISKLESGLLSINSEQARLSQGEWLLTIWEDGLLTQFLLEGPIS